MIACEKDNEAIIEKLLDNGASVAQKNKVCMHFMISYISVLLNLLL